MSLPRCLLSFGLGTVLSSGLSLCVTASQSARRLGDSAGNLCQTGFALRDPDVSRPEEITDTLEDRQSGPAVVPSYGKAAGEKRNTRSDGKHSVRKDLPLFGPPLPPERIRVKQQAKRLREAWDAGRIALIMPARDGEQLRALEQDGVYCWPAPPAGVNVHSSRQRVVLEGTTDTRPAKSSGGASLPSRGVLFDRTGGNPADDPDFDPCAQPPAPLLLHLIVTLAGHSSPARPLEILSLLRPPYRVGGFVHVGPANPHSMGLAVDIGGYGGHTIRQEHPQECVAATLAVLKDLPPGRYRLGLPKAPEGAQSLPRELQMLLNASGMPAPADACRAAALYGLHASSAKEAWPFFPAPYEEVLAADNRDDAGETAAVTGKSRTAGGQAARPRLIVRYQNEAYAPESELEDARLRKALEAVRKRGVDIIAMFPDGADHLHVDVRQNF